MLRKLILSGALSHGLKLFPSVLAFLKRWWLAIVLAVLLIGGVCAWLAISLFIWAWNMLPELVGYVVNHFAPAFNLQPAPVTGATPLESI